MLPGLERRVFKPTHRLELRKARADGGAETSQIRGYGAVFNSETNIGNWFREVIMPGAFAPVIGAGADVRSLFNHDPNYVLARTVAGTCRLSEDETGLLYEDDVNQDDPMALGVAARISRGDVTGSSFGFRVKREEWVEPDDGSAELPLRIIHEFAELVDVGPVTFPAYEDSTSEARAAAQATATVGAMTVEMRAKLVARLEGRSVPKNVSTKKAPTDTPWSVPGLVDFSTKSWDDLTSSERSHIAGHFAWKAGDTFGDLHLPHHRASDGAIVLRGVVAAAGRINQTSGINKSAVRTHLEAHYHAFELKAPWEPDASSARDVDAAIARQDDELGEEAAELVGYQTMATMLAQAQAALDSAASQVRELIAAETETPTTDDAGEAAEEEVETARLESLVALCGQVCNTVDGVARLAQAELEDEDDEAADMAGRAARDVDRRRRLQLAQSMTEVTK